MYKYYVMHELIFLPVLSTDYFSAKYKLKAVKRLHFYPCCFGLKKNNFKVGVVTEYN